MESPPAKDQALTWIKEQVDVSFAKNTAEAEERGDSFYVTAVFREDSLGYVTFKMLSPEPTEVRVRFPLLGDDGSPRYYWNLGIHLAAFLDSRWAFRDSVLVQLFDGGRVVDASEYFGY
ncbi:hypothetical protein [Amycolatopsis sp. CA-230715]|uniref:hypothetical protein n=1 Tax=Amycolatopsis sp. CA-230715 TaxID=2745196 RepID=UPI001C011325|nr:hypothetical protein [Amycolatopsis sp. CA-230715]